MRSPYNPGFGARPSVLVGREAQLARVRSSLARVQNSGAPLSSATVLVGARGLGKTVMLGVIGEEARARGFVTVDVALDSVSDVPRLLAARLGSSVEGLERTAGRTAWRAVLARLSGLSVELSAGVVTVTSEAPKQSEDLQAASDRDHLAGLLVAAAHLGREGRGAGLVLLIDELQEARRRDLVVLTNALQDALRDPTAALAVFAAGLPDTPDRVTSAASFTERFDFRQLRRLDREDAERALVDPALTLGVTWEQDAVDAVVHAAGGSPYLLQLFGDEVWTLADPEPEDRLSRTQVDAALADARERLYDGMFRSRWAKATPGERDFMAGMARTADADGVSASSRYAPALGRTTQQLSSVRQALIDKGLVESAGFGLLRFTVPGFADFVVDTVGPGTDD